MLTASVQTLGNLPLGFEVNAGQVDSQVDFVSRGRGYAVFLTPGTAVLSMSSAAFDSTNDETSEPADAAVLSVQLAGANVTDAAAGLDLLTGKSNYFVGSDPSQWFTNIDVYGRVKYANVYPGIDQIFHGTDGNLRYDFVVAPGSDPALIDMQFAGADNLSIDAEGNLQIAIGSKTVVQHAPVLYQEIGGLQQPVSGYYVLHGTTNVGFAVGPYDTTRPLTIDPTLTYSTYLGGSGNDQALGVAVDATGIYLTGLMASTSFPTISGMITAATNANPIVVTSANHGLITGTQITISGAVGNTNANGVRTITVIDANTFSLNGIAGNGTFSGNAGWTTVPAFDSGNNGGNDVFVAKLNPAGNQILYFTYLGSTGDDRGFGIALDASGNAYLTGRTASANFPLMLPAQATLGGGVDAFVTKLNAAGNGLIYSTYLGGSADENASPLSGLSGGGIALDGAGNAWVTGMTISTNFPVVNGFQTSHGADSGNRDAFVTRVNAAGTAFDYSTYLGGTSDDRGAGIAVDGSGKAYVVGMELSSVGALGSGNFPTTTGAFQPTKRGSWDAFVSKIDPTLTSIATLVYSTLVGGNSDEFGQAIAVDSSSNAYVTGLSWTSSTTFPLVNAFQTAGAGSYDAFITKINATGSSAVYSTRLGGTGDDRGNGIAVDAAGNAFIAGHTTSVNFPVASPSQALIGNAQGLNTNDAFVAKLNAAGNGVLYSTYMGGSANDQATAIAIDSSGAAYVAGFSASSDFPTTTASPLSSPAFRSTNAGGNDAFVAKLTDTPNHPPVLATIGSRAVTLDASGSADLVSFAAAATDPDLPTQALTFSLTSSDAPGASVTAGGSFLFDPTAAGVFTTTVRVTDTAGDYNETTFSVIVNAAAPAPIVNPPPDAAGSALRMDGVNDWVAIPDRGPQLVGDQTVDALHSSRELTVAGWFKLDSLDNTYQSPFYKGNWPNCSEAGCSQREYATFIYKDGSIIAASTPVSGIGTSTTYVSTGAGVIQPSRWYNFAMVISADTNFFGLYLNGDLVASGGYDASGIRDTDGPLRFGDADHPLQGSIDNYSLWHRALTQSEIQGMMHGPPLTGNEIGLRGYWKFDEGNGTTFADQTANDNDGSLLGVLLREPGALGGDPDTAIEFDGGQVQTTIPQLNTTSGADNTVSFWMNWDGTEWVMPIGFSTYNLMLINGHFGFSTLGTGNDVFGISSAGLNDRWVHVSAIFRNGNSTLSQLYIDGVQQTLTQRQGTPVTNRNISTAVRISGWTGDSYWHFRGGLDEVAFFNRALTPAEILAQHDARNVNYNSTVQGQTPVGYYRLGEVSGTTIFDSSTSNPANHGVIETSVNGVTQGAAGALGGDSNTATTFTPGGTVALTIPQLNTASGGTNTVSFWMNWNGTDYRMPVGFQTYGLYLQGGYFGFHTTTSGQTDIYGISSTGLANQWKHVTAVFNNGDITQCKLYINGVEQALAQRPGTTPTQRSATVAVRISGRPIDNYLRFGGSLDEVAFFNRTLTTDEVTAQFNAQNVNYNAIVQSQKPVGYYRLGEASGLTVVDSSDNDNDGQLGLNVNQPAWNTSTALLYAAAPATIIATVTNTADSGPGSLRQVLSDVNALGGALPVTIQFNIPDTDPDFVDSDAAAPGGDAGKDVFVIQSLTALPALTHPNTTIDGGSQISFGGNTNALGPEIVLNGQFAGFSTGLLLNSGSNTIKGLLVQNFGGHGIHVNGTSGNVILDNSIGTDATGTLVRPNGLDGIFVNSSGANSIGGISGLGSMTKSGAGTLTMTAANTYIGTTTVNAGTLLMNAANTYTGTTVVNGGTLQTNVANAIPATSAVSLANAASAILNLNNFSQTIGSLAGGGTTGGNVNLGSGSLTLANTATTTYSGIISGSGSLVVQGGNSTTLSGANTYSGGTAVTGIGALTPILTLTNNTAAGTGPIVVTSTTGGGGPSGARVAVQGNITVNNSLSLSSNTVGDIRTNIFVNSGNNTWSGPITLNGTGLINIASNTTASLNLSGGLVGPAYTGSFFAARDNVNFTTTISGPINLPTGHIFVTNNANVVISSTGNTLASIRPVSGTIRLGADNALPATVDLLMGQANSTGIFDLAGFDQEIDTFSVNAGSPANLQFVVNRSTASDSILTFNGGSSTFAGIIQNSVAGGTRTVGLTVAGGSLTLSGVNTYSGATTVNGGTLLVSGSIAASAVTVNSGGTLGGSGTTGTVTVNSGGTLAPGSSPSIINTGNLSLAAGGIYSVELNGLTAGTQYDRTNVAGSVNLGGATLAISRGFNPVAGDGFTIITNDGSDPVVGTFAGLPEGATFIAAGATFQITYQGGDGNDVVVNVPPVLAPIANQSVLEGGSLTLTASATNIGATSVTYSLGPGAPVGAAINPTTGVFTLGPPATNDDQVHTITVRATVSGLPNLFDEETFTITVNNVAPSLTADEIEIDPATLNEGGSVHLAGSFTDPGAGDSHEVVIIWGDGSPNSTISLAAGVTLFSADHAYVDDAIQIQISLRDDEMILAGAPPITANVPITVNNVAPVIQDNDLILDHSEIDEDGSVILTGSFADAGVSDTHGVLIHWGDGSSSAAVVDQQARTFAATHRYPDDRPTNTSFDNYSVQAIVTDDDGSTTLGLTQVRVNNVTPAGLVLNLRQGVIDENGSVTLNGSFVDPGTEDTHLVVIQWGDGSANTTISGANVAFNPQTLRFEFSTSHTYLDDNPTGTDSDVYAIQVTAADDDQPASPASATASITVHNVAPQIAPADLILTDLQNVALSSVSEGGSVKLSGSFIDAGTLDAHTVVIHWGDGNSTGLGAGQVTFNANTQRFEFSATHSYPDDHPTGSPVDNYSISVEVSDDDFVYDPFAPVGDPFQDSAVAPLIVTNVNPAVTAIAVLNSSAELDNSFDEGQTATVTGSYSDVGVLDSHTVLVNWGDGSTSPAVVDQQARTFTASHRYLDDDDTVAGTSFDQYTIGVTVSDDDGGQGIAGTAVTVSNLSPTTEIRPRDGSTVTALLMSAFVTDPSELDTFAYTWTVNASPGGSAPFTTTLDGANIQFAHNGTSKYIVTVQATDDDSGVSNLARALVIRGSGAADVITITFNPGTGLGSVSVDYGGTTSDPSPISFNPADIDRIVVFGLEGDDTIDATDADLPTNLPIIVDGGPGADQIALGPADDIAFLSGDGEIVNLGGGNNTGFVNISSTLTLIAGSGDNTLNLSPTSFGVTFDLTLNNGQLQDVDPLLEAGGDHFLRLTGNFTTLIGGAFDDDLTAASGSTLFGGAGSDVFRVKTNFATGISISGDEGADYFINDGGGVADITFDGGADADVFENFGDSVTNIDFSGDAGNDRFINRGNFVTGINFQGDEGADVFTNYAGAGVFDITFDGGADNDEFHNLGGGVRKISFFGDEGADIFVNDGDLVTEITFSGGADADFFENNGDGVFSIDFSGDEGADYFLNYGDSVAEITFAGGADADVFENNGDDVLAIDFSGDEGADIFVNDGLGVVDISFAGGADADRFENHGFGVGRITFFGDEGADVFINNGDGNEVTEITFAGGADADAFHNNGDYVLLIDFSGDEGADVFVNEGLGVVEIDFSGDEGADVFINDGDGLGVTEITFAGGADADAFRNRGPNVHFIGFLGDEGADLFINDGAGVEEITFTGGADADFFENNGDGVITIDFSGDEGADIFINDGDQVVDITFAGGADADFFENNGDGVITIDFSGDEGADIFINEGDGVVDITFEGGADADSFKNTGLAVGMLRFFGDEGADTFINEGIGVVDIEFSGDEGADIFINDGDGLGVTEIIFGGGADADAFQNNGDGVASIDFSGDEGADVFENNGDAVAEIIYDGGADADFFENNGDGVLAIDFSGDEGADVFVNEGIGVLEIEFSGDEGADVFINSGEGSDVTEITFTGGADADFFRNSGHAVRLITFAGDPGADVFINNGDGSVTGTEITFLGGADADAFQNNGDFVDEIVFIGGADADVFENNGEAVEFISFEGDEGADLFINNGDDVLAIDFAGDEGADTFINDGNDVLDITFEGGADADAFQNNGDGVVDIDFFGDEGADVFINEGDGVADITFVGGADADGFRNGGNNVTAIFFAGDDGADVLINDGTGVEDITFMGGADADYFENNGESVTTIDFSGDDGADTFINDGFGVEEITFTGGADDDAFRNNANSVLRIVVHGDFDGVPPAGAGDEGADVLINDGTGVEEITFFGGADADTFENNGDGVLAIDFSGDDGADVFTNNGDAVESIIFVGGADADVFTNNGDGVSDIEFSGDEGPDAFINAGDDVTGIDFGGDDGADVFVNTGDNVTDIEFSGDTGDDTVTLSGNSQGTFAGGSGNDTYVFVGGNLGSVTIEEAADVDIDTLDFSSFVDSDSPQVGITIYLTLTGQQVVNPNDLVITLSTSTGIENVVGSPRADTIIGNDRPNRLLGSDQIDGVDTSMPSLPWNGVTQLVFLDFDSDTVAGEHVYTPEERAAIQARIEADYFGPDAANPWFHFSFTQTKPPDGTVYAWLHFNQTPADSGRPGGFADQLDFRNTNLGGNASIQVNGLLGGLGQPEGTSENFVALSAKIGGHELGHLVGLRHQDSFGPIGYGIHAPPGPGPYTPDYPGPSAAYETFNHLIGSPATIGSNRFNDIRDLYWGEREAVKLAFIGQGTTVPESTAATQSGLGSANCAGIIVASLCRIGQDLGGLAQLNVPNTLGPSAVNAGKEWHVAAIAVVGPSGSSASIAIDPATGRSENDFYSFDGVAGELVNIEVMSNGLTRLGSLANDIVDPILRVYDSSGLLVAYFDSAAVNDDQFEPTDSSIIDLKLPATGKYYVEVDTFARAPGDPICSTSPGSGGPLDPNNLQSILNPSNANFNSDLRARFEDTCFDTDTGEYELFIYRFDTATGDIGDTLRGGGGADVLLGGGGLDDLKGGPGLDQLFGGSADDDGLYVVTVNAGSDGLRNEGQPFTGSGSLADPGGDSWTATVNYGDGTGSLPLALHPDKSFGLSHPYANNGAYTVTVTITSDDGLVGQDTLSVIVENVAPTVTLNGMAAGTEGATLHYTFTTSDPGADTFSLVAISGGSVGTVSNVVFNSATGAGSFDVTFSNDTLASTVSVQVQDSDNALSNVSSINVAVSNVAPVVNAGADAVVLLNGGTAPFTATGSFVDPGSDSWTATVNYGAGVGMQPLSLTGKGFSLNYPYAARGTFTVTVCVSDDDDSSCDALVVTVPAVQLNVQITNLPTPPVNEGTPITLNSNSTPNATGVVTYGWNVLKGGQLVTSGNGPSFTFTPDDEGSYVVTLAVVGANGAGNATPATIVVENVSPTVSLSGPNSAFEGDTIHYTFAATDPGADTFSIAATSAGVVGTVSNVLFNAVTGIGSFDVAFSDDAPISTVSVQVKDSDGALSNVSSINVDVDNVAPLVNAGANATINEGGMFAGSGSFIDPGADVWTATVDYGEGAGPITLNLTGKSFALSNLYEQDGVYTVAVCVTDDQMQTCDTLTVTVNNVAPQSVNAGPNQFVFEGDTVWLTGSFTDPGSFDTHMQTWSVSASNGQVVNGNGGNFSFVPYDNGIYTVNYTVDDGDGGVASDTASITVNNVAPKFETGLSYPPTSEGTPIVLDASAFVTDAGSNDTIISHLWIVTKNSVAFGVPGTQATYTFTPDDEGTYVVTLTVQDDDHAFASTQYFIIVDNANPDPAIQGAPSSDSPEGTAITLNSTVTDPGAVDIISRVWSVKKNGSAYVLPPGTITTAAAFSFTPDDEGQYEVMLSASDGDGGSGLASKIINVTNARPVANILDAPATEINEGTLITLASHVTDAGSTDTVASYAWTVTKNGNPFGVPGNLASYQFTPNDNGVYVVKLVATDNDNGPSIPVSRTIQVKNVAPQNVSAGPDQTVAEGTPVTLTGAFNDPGTADTHPFLWKLVSSTNGAAIDDGDQQTFPLAALDYGIYTFRLTVADDDGGSASDTVVITVENVAPQNIDADADAETVNEGDTVHLTGSFTNSNSRDVYTQTWKVTATNGQVISNGSEDSFSFVPNDNGIYTVIYTVADDDGSSASDTVLITVDNVAPVLTLAGQNASAGVAKTFSLGSFTDAGTEDKHLLASIDWGDGSLTTPAIVSETAGSGTLSGEHAYAVGGTYSITVTLKDDDGLSHTKSINVVVAASVRLNGTSLEIIGTNDRDLIFVHKLFGTIYVHTLFGIPSHDNDDNGCGEGYDENWLQIFQLYRRYEFTAASVQSILVRTHGGNDHVYLSSFTISQPANIDGGEGQDWLHGGAGNDTITDLSGNNVIFTGGGANVVTTGPGNDTIWGGSGNDTINAGEGNNYVYAGSGDDAITAGSGVDKIWGGEGNDAIAAGDGNNQVWGEEGNDVITTGMHVDTVDAGGGNDWIRSGAGNDTVDGGDGNDVLLGGDGNDVLKGGNHKDLMIGGTGADTIYGNADQDILIAGTTTHDADDVALAAIMAEWTSSRSYQQRVYNLSDGTAGTGLDNSKFGSRANQGWYLIGNDCATQTVFNDNEIDTLAGNAGTDWYYANLTNDNGGPLDVITGLESGEKKSDSDF